MNSHIIKTHDGELSWDKDTPPHLDFVTACANIRMYIFNIQQKSRYGSFQEQIYGQVRYGNR